MKLAEILAYLDDILEVTGTADGSLDIGGIAYDSRKVKENDLFIAIGGNKSDGHDYIAQAVEKGAVAVIGERKIEGLPSRIPLLLTKDSRLALAHLSSFWWGFPDRRMRLIGVTGTNGKTTTTHLIKYLLECAGQKTGLVGTINNYIGDELVPATHTTPESWELFQLFAQMLDSGCENVVMEVSSHALKQGRVAACKFDGVVFTNLTQDHLDFHLTFADYLESKTILFRYPRYDNISNKYGVVNIDDPAKESFVKVCEVPIWTYGLDQDASLRASGYRFDSGGTSFVLEYQGQQTEVNIPLIGKFNIYNTLAAMTVALAEGLALTDIVRWLRSAPQVRGRFELIDEGQDYTVIVDYAHTPDGLLNVLSAAKELKPSHLISVFGCGGNRDKGKRPIMGRIAAKHSDFVVITSDNPRYEEPLEIIKEIEAGAKELTGEYMIEENRREAIKAALKRAKKGDIVVIAGKGHEDYQLVKDQVLHFDDAEEARIILKNAKNT